MASFNWAHPVFSDVVLESGSVLESDSSTYFEDSDSDSNRRTPGLGWTRGVQELDSALYDLELGKLGKEYLNTLLCKFYTFF